LFIKNTILIVKRCEFIYFRNKDIKLEGLKYETILKKYPDIAYNFQKFMLDIVYIVTDEEEMIELFFSRLNSGKPLNNTEKRKAMISFINDRIEKCVNEHLFFNRKIGVNNIRNTYNDIMAKLILLEKSHGFVNMDKKALDNLYTDFREESNNINLIIEEVEKNLLFMSKVFQDKDKLLKVKASIPVYYWLIRNNSIDRNVLREFLNEFDEERKNSKDPDIVEYNKYQQKGTDKKVSMEYRYNYLEKRLRS